MLFIDANREGYEPEQIYETMTVGELIDYLRSNFYSDEKIYLRHDNGYTYGGITEHCFCEH